ncbi:MAG: carboxypeptidase-like regulatory domain-containing protein [Terriglobales bacterium]
MAGTVLDPSHAAVPGAAVKVMGITTGIRLSTKTGADGHYALANVAPGSYLVTVSKTGFKTGTFQEVTVVANQTYTLNATLQVGSQATTITVEAGQSVLQTQETSVGTSITGAVITTLPSASSDSALYSLTMTDPAIQTMGAPRQSSALGLPGGAVNITIDGISAQWESGKSGDPLFTMITPNTSDTAEFDVVSAAGAANQTGDGSVQINYTSKRGTNSFHGSVFDYFRNSGLNSNYYFNNLAGQPIPIMQFNQWGYTIGGPIWKNKLFFFTDLTRFSQPEGEIANSTMLNADAQKGLFDYSPTTMPSSATPNAWTTCNAGTGTCQANLYAMANAYNAQSGGSAPIAEDAFVGKMLGAAASMGPGETLTTPPSSYQEALVFPESGSNIQENPDARLDYNINSKNSLEFDWHLSRLIINPDDLNGGGATYPVAPFATEQFGYAADRAIWAAAWRWQVTPTMNNELRVGFQSSPSIFGYEQGSTLYPEISTDLGSIRMAPNLPGNYPNSDNLNSPLVTNPYLSYGPSSEWDNVYQLIDNLAWVHGNHNMTFGMTATRQRYSEQDNGNVVAGVNLGWSGSEPMETFFTGGANGNLPGITSADLVAAEDTYGLLTGNVTSYRGSVALNPSTRQFQTGAPEFQQMHQTDLGFFGTDSWRVRPNLTVNYGLRWQFEGVPKDDENEYFVVNGGPGAVYGISGAGNLFMPGTLTGATPSFTNDLNAKWYNNWYKGFAPSLGVAWEPHGGGWLFGNGGQTVLRAGYSISYSREGLENFQSIAGGNPGYTGAQFASAAPYATSQPAGLYNAGTIQIGTDVAGGSKSTLPLVQTPASFSSTIPIDPNSTSNYVNAFDPNLHMPYVESWTVGIQRQLGQHTALEIRYVGNHGVGLLDQLNMNEVNIFQPGSENFLNEFKNAVGNLNACMANKACAASPTFANTGLHDQVNVPIMTAAFNAPGAGTATTTASQQAAGFSNGGFISDLQTGQAGALADSLATTYNYWQDFSGNGYPSNLFTVNPDALGGAYYLRNGLQSTYNGLMIIIRRRPIHGLTLDGSYTWSHSLTDDWQRNGNNYTDEVTLRDPGLMKGPAPFDIRSAFKFYSMWELPFGRGEHWGGSASSLLNTFIGGWDFDSNIMLQSGRPGLLTGGYDTFNNEDGGVQLTGTSVQQLQSQMGVYKTAAPAPGAVWYVPQNLLGPGGEGVNTSVISPCTTPGQECQRIFIYDAPFFMPDFSLVKNTQITERVASQIQVQVLDAFNNANFFWTGSAATFGTAGANLQTPNFGQITNAYQAVDSNSDYGGRTIQIVARFIF